MAGENYEDSERLFPKSILESNLKRGQCLTIGIVSMRCCIGHKHLGEYTLSRSNDESSSSGGSRVRKR